MSDNRKEADGFRCNGLWIFVSANREVLLILILSLKNQNLFKFPLKKQTNKACFSKPVPLFSNLNVLFCSTFFTTFTLF